MTIHPPPQGGPPDAPALSGPLRISIVPIPGAGEIGLTHCPGRRHVDAAQRRWRRSLPDDLTAIAQWGAVGVVSLLEPHEFSKLGVPDLPRQVQAQSLRWFHLAIADMQTPGASFDQAWSDHGQEILGILARGNRIVLHCAAGLGRSGMVAAKILTAFEMPPEQAISLVRKQRPGTIETVGQAEYVLTGTPLTGGC